MPPSRDEPAVVQSHRVGHTLIRASAWVTLTEFSIQALTAASTILAARIVAPAEFGLVGVVSLASATLGAFTQSGFEDALVQRRERIDALLNTVWTWNVLRGLFFFLFLSALSPLLARVYGEPRLVPLTIAASVAPLLSAFGNIGLVLFQRSLDFRRLFFIQVIQVAVKGMVFIPAVLVFQNAWALVIGNVAAAGISTLVTYAAHPYRPRFSLAREKVQELFRYGKWVTFMAAIIFVSTQGDDMFVSKYFGLEALAFYQMAYEIGNLPATKVSHVFSRAMFPTLSRLDPGSAESRRAAKNLFRGIMAIAAPLSVLLFFATREYVDHVVGKKWSPIVPLVQILVVSGLVRGFVAVGGTYFNAVGRPDVNFRLHVPRFAGLLLFVWPLSHYYGLPGASVAVVISSVVMLPVFAAGMRSLAELGLWTLLYECRLAWVMAVVLGACLGFSRRLFGEHWYGALAWLLSSFAAWVFGMWIVSKVTSLDAFAQLGELRRQARTPAASIE